MPPTTPPSHSFISEPIHGECAVAKTTCRCLFTRAPWKVIVKVGDMTLECVFCLQSTVASAHPPRGVGPFGCGSSTCVLGSIRPMQRMRSICPSPYTVVLASWQRTTCKAAARRFSLLQTGEGSTPRTKKDTNPTKNNLRSSEISQIN